MWLDPDDPLSVSIRRLRWMLQRALAAGGVLLCIALMLGCPHIQTSYQYLDTGQDYIRPEDRVLASASYLGPFGWQQITYGDFDGGLPIVKFLPFHDCIDFKHYENVIPFCFLPQEYRDGQPAH